MTLIEVGYPDTLKILRETHSIWSAGLSASDYYRYHDLQRNNPWGQRHIKVLAVTAGDGDIAASCRVYSIEMASRGRHYQFIGIGAMYARKAYRGQGYAGKLLDELNDRAQKDGTAGLILFSDIGAAFYEQFGFQELSSVDFSLELKNLPPLAEISYRSEDLGLHHIDLLERYRQRWQARRPFALVRDPLLWNYKISKEKYLHSFSAAGWPGLQILTVEGAYCIYEVGGRSLRILELVAAAGEEEKIWQAVFCHGAKLGVRRIRGWEGNLMELAPAFNLPGLLAEGVDRVRNGPELAGPTGKMQYLERNWGRIMIHFIDPSIEHWAWQFPCPLTELDHL